MNKQRASLAVWIRDPDMDPEQSTRNTNKKSLPCVTYALTGVYVEISRGSFDVSKVGAAENMHATSSSMHAYRRLGICMFSVL